MKNTNLQSITKLIGQLTKFATEVKSSEHAETWHALTDYNAYLDECFHIIQTEYKDLLNKGFISRGLLELCWDLGETRPQYDIEDYL